MEEKDFIILDTIARTQNITKAAELLFTTQSAISKRIVLIEAELNTTLMTRSRLGSRLTPEGEIVLKHVRRASDILHNMRTELERSHEYVSGTLNAGISINYARYILPDLLAEFRKNYPNVTTHINTNQSRDIFMRLLNNELDVAIVRGSYDWKEGKVLLSTENICAIFSRNDKDKTLAEIPYIARKTDIAFEREILQWMRENNLRPEANIYVDSIETCTEMVKRGIGWAIIPEICLENFDGEISKLTFSDSKPFIRPTFLLYSEAALSLPQVNVFIDTVKKFHGLLNVS